MKIVHKMKRIYQKRNKEHDENKNRIKIII